MEVKNNRLQGVKFLESPNFNDRPKGCDISLLVIHSISLPPKTYNTNHIEKFFLNELDFSLHNFYKEIQDIKVSSHILIKRNGEVTLKFLLIFLSKEMERLFNLFPLISVLGMLEYPHLMVKMIVIIFQ